MIRLLVLSDIHFAGEAEQQRCGHEAAIIANPLLRVATRAYRHFLWLRDPFAHNHLLDAFLAEAGEPGLVVANGDLSCDTRFVGLSDDATFESARQCLGKLRQAFGPKIRVVLGDHELGKMSLFGGHGGLRLASWDRASTALGLEPFWRHDVGRHVLLGVTSSLVALPVFEPETLPEERPRWNELRSDHLSRIRAAFAGLNPDQRLILFCHDPTALSFLWREEVVRAKCGQIEWTVIGHLHSKLILWKSRVLAGMPSIRFLGNSIRRMSTALNEGRCWRHFRVRLCPSLAGIQLLKDGGYLELGLDAPASAPGRIRFHPLPWR